MNLFNQLMKWLWEKNESVNRRPSGKVNEIHSHIMYDFLKIENSSILESMLPNQDHPKVNFQDSRRFLYLEPTEIGNYMVPVLSWQCDFSQKPIPEIRIYLSLFQLDKDKQLKAIGYRFETPEKGNRHYFYHAQLIKNFLNGKPAWCHQCREWLSERQPSFILDARDPISLLICLLISLYGLDYIDKNLLTANFKNELVPYVRNMAWKNLAINAENIKHKKK